MLCVSVQVKIQSPVDLIQETILAINYCLRNMLWCTLIVKRPVLEKHE